SREPKRSEDSTGENHMTSTDTYAADSAALLIVDPYNDFMSEGGITAAGAALANAVSNARGVEVTKLPLRPEYIMELVRRGDGSGPWNIHHARQEQERSGTHRRPRSSPCAGHSHDGGFRMERPPGISP